MTTGLFSSTRLWLAKHYSTVIVFFVALGLIWYNAAPGLSFHDSGEFALAVACKGLPHPPGAPTWTIGATLFYHLLPFKDAAYACNLYTGLWGALTLALMHAFMLMWIRLNHPDTRPALAQMYSLLPVVVLFGSPAFLEQALITEQYTLMTALMMGLLIIFVWNLHRPGAPLYRLSAVAGLLWGLAIGNHPSQICLLIPMGWYIWLAFRRTGSIGGTLRHGGALVAGLAAGLMVFLYLPYVGAQDRLFDTVRAVNWDRFLSAIERKAYVRREITDAPDGFTREWMLTYNFIGELGLLGFLLSVIGLVYGVRQKGLLAWLAFFILPYAVGLYYGHLIQGGMDILYIRYYGLRDWHIPIYMGTALLAGFGLFAADFLRFRRNLSARLGLIGAAGVLAICSIVSIQSLRSNTARNWHAAEQFASEALAPVSNGSTLMLNTDDLLCPISYLLYEKKQKAALVYVSRSESMPSQSSNFLEMKKELFRLCTLIGIDDLNQPFHPKGFSADNISTATELYMNYVSPGKELAKHLLPVGFLFRFEPEVTSSTVRDAEMDWRTRHPDALRMPQSSTHRLERAAYGTAYWRRTIVFFDFQLYDLAAEEARRALEWLPDSETLWVYLGLSHEALGGPANQKNALIAYETATELAPQFAEAWYRMGTVLVNTGQVSKGIASLEKALELQPDYKDAQINLNYARSLK